MVRFIELHSLKGRVVLYFNHTSITLKREVERCFVAWEQLWRRGGLQSKPSGADLLPYFMSVKRLS